MAFEKYNSQRFIYLADDDSDDREFFTDALSEIDQDVILRQEQDGMHLMDSLLTLSGSELPEFIFLDINMPGKSGLECLQEIRNLSGGLKEVSIIMLSTSSDPENIQKASELGATCYAVKPSSFEKLKSLLREVLSMNPVGTLQEKKKFLLL
jgi:DNA-binding response OmpR family regulator